MRLWFGSTLSCSTARIASMGQLMDRGLGTQVRVHGDAHMETLERLTFGGKMLGPWSAHPKTDPATGARPPALPCLLLPFASFTSACLDVIANRNSCGLQGPRTAGALFLLCMVAV